MCVHATLHRPSSLTMSVRLLEHQPSEEQSVPLGQQVRRSGQQTPSENGQHPHSNSDPRELQDVSAEKQSTFHSTVEAGTIFS